MISATVNDSSVMDALRKLSASTYDLSPVMGEIGETIRSSVDLNFVDSSDPWGGKWRSLSRATIMQRLGRGKDNFKKDGKISKKGQSVAMSGFQPLMDTGRLRSSITYQATGNSVTVGTKLIYAATHQFGRDHIPARPFMPIRNGEVDLPAPLRDEIIGTIGDHIMRAVGK